MSDPVLILDMSPETAILKGTSGVPVKTRSDGTNQARYILQFDDASTESCYFVLPMPPVDTFATALKADAEIHFGFYAETIVDTKQIEWGLSWGHIESLDDIDEALGSEIIIPAITMSTGEESEEKTVTHTIANMFSSAPSDLTKPFRLVIKLRRQVSGPNNMTEDVFFTGGVLNVSYIPTGGTVIRSRQEISNATADVDADKYDIAVRANSANATATLPASPYDGQEHRFRALDVTNTITIDGNGKDIKYSPASTASTLNMANQYDAITLCFDSTQDCWFVV